jgi:hypothetical protein
VNWLLAAALSIIGTIDASVIAPTTFTLLLD